MSIEESIRSIIREELQVILGRLPPQQGETIVDYETRTSEELVEEVISQPAVSILPTKTISNTADLMAAIKELCDKPGMATKAKALLRANFDFDKFSGVADESAQEVYDFMEANKGELQ